MQASLAFVSSTVLISNAHMHGADQSIPKCFLYTLLGIRTRSTAASFITPREGLCFIYLFNLSLQLIHILIYNNILK